MKNLIYTAALAMVFSFCSCANKTEEKGAEAVNLNNISLASDKDLVCEMTVNGKVADTIAYNGKIYGFCNPGCKEEFKKDPAQYVKE